MNYEFTSEQWREIIVHLLNRIDDCKELAAIYDHILSDYGL